MTTFKELIDGLSAILKEHPELADREVCVASECGFSDTGFLVSCDYSYSCFYLRI